MKLNDEQKQKLLEKLGFLKTSRCSTCGASSWIVNDTIFEMREFQGGNLVIGGGTAILPVIPVTCKNCGQTIFFNALSLKLIESKNDTTG